MSRIKYLVDLYNRYHCGELQVILDKYEGMPADQVTFKSIKYDLFKNYPEIKNIQITSMIDGTLNIEFEERYGRQ